MEKATFAGGCFWCTSAVFQDIIGVESVVSEFIDGHVRNPRYREICSGTTGHAEAIEIDFNPEIITYEELLEIFWSTHDPTTLNSQGNDVGTQYRSGIYTHSKDQNVKAIRSRNKIATELWGDAIVTEIKVASQFYSADKYHQNYYRRNSHVGYCSVVIGPKIAKARLKFSDKIKAA